MKEKRAVCYANCYLLFFSPLILTLLFACFATFCQMPYKAVELRIDAVVSVLISGTVLNLLIMLSCGYFHVMYYIKALVKKAGPPILGFNHERPNSNDGTMEEFRSAICHTKDSKTVFSAPTFNLDTVEVLALFKKMVDEVCFYSHLHFINFCTIFLFLVQEYVVLRILK